MHLYKAKLCLLSRSVKPLKKEIKAAMNIDHRDPRAIALKAHMDYLRQDFRKSLRHLNTLRVNSKETSANQEIYANNHACLQFRLSKFPAAVHFFARALELNVILSQDAVASGLLALLSLVVFAFVFSPSQTHILLGSPCWCHRASK